MCENIDNWTVYRWIKLEIATRDNGETILLDITSSVRQLYNRIRVTEKLANDVEHDLCPKTIVR